MKRPLQPSALLVDQLTEQVSKGEKSILDAGKELGLRMKQMLFVRMYVSGKHGYNASRIVSEIYEYPLDENENPTPVARNAASIIMKNPYIKALLSIAYVSSGLSKTTIDRELLKALQQDINPIAKVAAAKELNDLLGRVKKETTVTIQPGINLQNLTDEQYEQWKQLYAIAATKQIENITDNTGDDNGGGLPQIVL